MRRIYWDTMLFIYLLDDHPKYAPRVRSLLETAYRRGDQLLCSFVGLGEVMAGAVTSPQAKKIRATIDEMGFSYLPFGEGGVEIFSELRSQHRVKTADAIHLACAAAAQVDLFLTGDAQLLKLNVPGIHFIADFNTPLL